MTDQEFFIKAVLQCIPVFAEKQGEDTAVARATMVARMLTGKVAALGLFDGEPTVCRDGMYIGVLSSSAPTGGSQGLVSANPQATGMQPNNGHGNLVSTAPRTAPVVVGPTG